MKHNRLLDPTLEKAVQNVMRATKNAADKMRTRPPITLTLSPEARAKLEVIAMCEGRTMSNTVEWLITSFDVVSKSSKGRKS